MRLAPKRSIALIGQLLQLRFLARHGQRLYGALKNSPLAHILATLRVEPDGRFDLRFQESHHGILPDGCGKAIKKPLGCGQILDAVSACQQNHFIENFRKRKYKIIAH